MDRHKGISLLEIIVVFFLLVMLFIFLMPYQGRVKPISQRVVCGTNLKGLGYAQAVYSNDYDGQYAVQGRGNEHTWGEYTEGWQDDRRDWGQSGGITVGASLYLLVRQADVSPKSFVCPSSDEWEFTGRNPGNLDIVDLWDFGQFDADPDGRWLSEGPARCVSYAYQQPYDPAGTSTGKAGQFRADDQQSAAFAIMADKNPWYDSKLELADADSDKPDYKVAVSLLANHWDKKIPGKQVRMANSQPHKKREGQNVLYADGHLSFERTPDVGVNSDNIYTHVDTDDPEFQLSAQLPSEQALWRRGIGIEHPDRSGRDETPACLEDSLLVNDFVGRVR